MRVSNIVVVGDTHVGCKMGLCPDGGFILDEGTPVEGSPLQSVVWSWWREFWDEFVPVATRGEPYAVVHIGDAMDGVHHNATTLFTNNMHDQILMAYQALLPVVERCEGRYYHIRGTEAHVGRSAEHEEALAAMLGAIPYEGRHSRWEMRARLGDRLIHFAHHIGTSTSPFAASGALQRLAVRSYVETGRRGDPPYAMLVRGHRHQHSEISERAAHGKVTVVTTPAWQLKTPYVHSKDGLQMGQPEIGGIVIRLADDELFTRAFVRRPDPPQEEVI